MKIKNNFSRMSKDSVNYLFVRIVPKLISFITIPIILRLITPKFWGEIALMLGLQSLTSAFLLRGRSSAGERYIVPLGEKKALNFLKKSNLNLIRNFFLIFLLFEFLNYLNYLNFLDIDYGMPFRLSLMGSLFLSFNTMYNSLLRALDSSDTILKGTFILGFSTPFIQLSLVVFIIFLEGFNDRMIVTAYFVGQCLAFGLTTQYLYKHVNNYLRDLDIQEQSNLNNRRINSFMNYSFLFYIFSSLLNWQDRYFLNYYLSKSDVGYYDATYKYVAMIGVVVGSFIWALSPVLNKKVEVSNEVYFDKLNNLSLLGFLLAVMGVYSIEIIGPILLPGKYINSLYIVPILAIAISFWNYGSVLTLIFKVKENQKIAAIGILITALTNGLLNFLMIPDYGILGASLALIISSILYFFYCSYYAFKFGFRFSKINYEILLITLVILLKYFYWDVVNYQILFIILIFSITLIRIFKLIKKIT